MFFKRIIFSFAFLLTGLCSWSQTTPKWIRYQSISPDGQHIVFTYKGDLYRVPTAGGDARQLTFHEAHDYMPVWSKDGSRLAFASERYGNFDVFVMDALGGPATRLTFHSNDEQPFSFSHDDQNVIFGAVRQDEAEHRQFPTSSQPELYSVPATAGRVGQVFTIPAEHVQVNRDGSLMVYHDKKGGENEWRKHHVSSITRDIWKYDSESGEHIMLTTFEGEDRQPVFSEDEQSLYFLSEESGSFNVHKLSLDNPSQREQLTSFETHPVRFLSQGNGVLAFGYDGELYTMQEGQQPQKVQVNIRTQAQGNPDKFITINGGVQEMDVSPNGKEIAFIARGEVFVTSVDGSLTKRITNTPEQERFVSFSPDGKHVMYSRENAGKWEIYQTARAREGEPFFYASTLLDERVLVSDEVDNYLASYSPDGKKLAYIAARRTLRVKDLDSGKTVDLLTPQDLFHMRDGDKYFTWSPDSKWLLVDWSKLLNNSEVLLLAADGSKRVNLTESGYYDSAPKWVNNGKQMIWFSNRDGLKSYATSGRTESDVYAMFFTQDAWDKYNMSEEDYKLMKEVEEASQKGTEEEDKKDKKKKEEQQEPVEFDWERLKERKARLTLHSSYLGDAVLSKDGEKLYYLAQFEDRMNLWETNLRTRETKMIIKLNTGRGSLAWDKEKENLYLLSGGSISQLDVDKGNSKNIKIAGEMSYDAEKERQHMLDHVYIRTKNVFYEPTFHGNNLEKLYEEYQKYLPHIGNSYEFSEMLSELLGELNVSHSGARYSRSGDNGDATASLGIFMDYDHQGEGIRIEEIVTGGPLDKAGFNVEPGYIIEKIDGQVVSPERDIAEYLNRKTGSFVLLELVSPRNERTQITVKPISLRDEGRLLYERFIRINEKEVEEKSNGRLGYVHIPGMSDGPYRSIFENMMGKYHDRDAVIIDTRFNGGGDLVADLAAFFTGTSFLTYATADKVVGGEPTSRWTKPTLSLYNESMYSDGHCYASGYSDLQIGKTVGMPVPGTCSFAGWESLPDGTRWGIVPVSAKDMSGDWMENNETAPDILVKNIPGVVDEGRDQQLERGIEELLKEVEPQN